jgi:tripartite-type tricarboxylate transporter receptor subunit TctC
MLMSAYGPSGAAAQDYPTKPVLVIVPYSQGSATDVIGRAVSKKLSEFWGQPVTVENRPGGGLGVDAVAKSSPDGCTLLVDSSAYAASTAIYAKLPYDPGKDLVAIAPFGRQPFALVVGPGAGVKTVKELVAAAKAKPGLSYGSAGTGTGTHFAAEKLKSATGIEVTHVPFKGGPEANAETASGKVFFWFPPVAMALKDVKEGKLIALGVTSAKRSSVLPDVPTMAEAGVAGVEDGNWWGLWAPAGTPAGVLAKLEKDVARALAAPDLIEQFAKMGLEPMKMSSAAFGEFVRGEMETAKQTVKALGIKPQ